MLSPSDDIWGMIVRMVIEDAHDKSSDTDDRHAISSIVFKVGGIRRISPALCFDKAFPGVVQRVSVISMES